ncbi:hypothetical protein ACFL0V_07560, partial [Nanoarchaeota archaeon]
AGKFGDVLAIAVQHPKWYQWGSGGNVRRADITPITKVPNQGASMLKQVLDYQGQRQELTDQMQDLAQQMSGLEASMGGAQ